MIEQDRISQILLSVAVLIIIFLATFENTAIVLFPVVLLISGLVMHQLVSKKHKTEFDDEPINENLVKNTIWYTLLAIFGMLACSYAIEHLSLNTESLQLTGYSLFLCDILIGISEEQFFRGFITDWMLESLPNSSHGTYLALFLSAGIFTVYHFAHYGTAVSSLGYVFAGGFILSWTAYKSKHLTPCMLGHIINNASAYLQNPVQLIVTLVKVMPK